MWYVEDRTDVGGWLREHGWDVSVLNTGEMMARYDGRPPEGIEGFWLQSPR